MNSSPALMANKNKRRWPDQARSSNESTGIESNPGSGSRSVTLDRTEVGLLFDRFSFWRNFSGRKRGSIVDRIVWLLVVWGLFIYMLAIAGIWWGSSHVIETSFKNQAHEWVRKFDELGTPLFASEDSRLFESIEDHAARFPELSYLRYYDAEASRVIAEYKSEKSANLHIPYLSTEHVSILRQKVEGGDAVFINSIEDGFALMQATAPILIRSVQSDGFMEFSLGTTDAGFEQHKVIGFIELGLDFGPYREQLLRNILYGSLLMAAIFLIAAVIGRSIIKMSLSPLTSLREPLQRLADGDIDVWVNGAGDQEIDAIANALNTTIAALKDRDQKLQQLASRDALTGLLNKQNFHMQLDLELKRVVAEQDTSALIFIDLDQFKHINDSLGHAVGDRLLAQVADLLANRTRETDVLSRFGGDEFTVIAKSVSRAEAEAIAELIVSGMQEFVFVEKNESFNICCSVGLAVIDSSGLSVEEIFSQADLACFQAKSNGRNCYYIFDSDSQQQAGLIADDSWSQRINEALSGDLFLLKFQPIVGLFESTYDFYEVQLQMRLQNGDVISSDIFLPAADRLGQAEKIGHWLLQNVLGKIAGLSVDGRNVKLVISLSSRFFEMSDLTDSVSRALAQYEIDPSSIVFQISEQTAIKHIEQTRKRMEALLEIGCRFSLSHFGTGSISFIYLKGLPVDFLKIDANYLTSTKSDPIDRVMVESTIKIARALGKQTIAEHIRNNKTIVKLREHDIDFGQGTYLSKPMTTMHAKSYKKLVGKFSGKSVDPTSGKA
jgi:diguanylate cyclase (GGDEF)-like protein